eukprot:500968_1
MYTTAKFIFKQSKRENILPKNEHKSDDDTVHLDIVDESEVSLQLKNTEQMCSRFKKRNRFNFTAERLYLTTTVGLCKLIGIFMLSLAVYMHSICDEYDYRNIKLILISNGLCWYLICPATCLVVWKWNVVTAFKLSVVLLSSIIGITAYFNLSDEFISLQYSRYVCAIAFSSYFTIFALFHSTYTVMAMRPSKSFDILGEGLDDGATFQFAGKPKLKRAVYYVMGASMLWVAMIFSFMFYDRKYLKYIDTECKIYRDIGIVVCGFHLFTMWLYLALSGSITVDSGFFIHHMVHAEICYYCMSKRYQFQSMESKDCSENISNYDNYMLYSILCHVLLDFANIFLPNKLFMSIIPKSKKFVQKKKRRRSIKKSTKLKTIIVLIRIIIVAWVICVFYYLLVQTQYTLRAKSQDGVTIVLMCIGLSCVGIAPFPKYASKKSQNVVMEQNDYQILMDQRLEKFMEEDDDLYL